MDLQTRFNDITSLAMHSFRENSLNSIQQLSQSEVSNYGHNKYSLSPLNMRDHSSNPQDILQNYQIGCETRGFSQLEKSNAKNMGKFQSLSNSASANQLDSFNYQPIEPYFVQDQCKQVRQGESFEKQFDQCIQKDQIRTLGNSLHGSSNNFLLNEKGYDSQLSNISSKEFQTFKQFNFNNEEFKVIPLNQTLGIQNIVPQESILQSSVDNNLQFITQTMPEVYQYEGLFRCDSLPEPQVLSQYLSSGITFEVKSYSQLRIDPQFILYFVPLKALRFVWKGNNQPPKTIEYQVVVKDSMERNHQLSCILGFQISQQVVNQKLQIEITVQHAYISQGLEHFMCQNSGELGDQVFFSRTPLETTILAQIQKNVQEHSTKQMDQQSKQDSMHEVKTSDFMDDKKPKKRSYGRAAGRQYDLSELPTITHPGQLLLSYDSEKDLQGEEDQHIESNTSSTTGTPRYCDNYQGTNSGPVNFDTDKLCGPVEMSVNQERCNIEFQPSNQVSDFVTPLKARGFRWAGQGQPPKSFSVKIQVHDGQKVWNITHILKFHKAKGDGMVPVMRFKISNFLGWRRFQRRWQIKKGDRLLFYKDHQPSTHTFLKLIRVQQKDAELVSQKVGVTKKPKSNHDVKVRQEKKSLKRNDQVASDGKNSTENSSRCLSSQTQQNLQQQDEFDLNDFPAFINDAKLPELNNEEIQFTNRNTQMYTDNVLDDLHTHGLAELQIPEDIQLDQEY